jgi:hypothetical protein
MQTVIAILTLPIALAFAIGRWKVDTNHGVTFKFGAPWSTPVGLAAGYLALCVLGAVPVTGFTAVVAWATLIVCGAVGLWALGATTNASVNVGMNPVGIAILFTGILAFYLAPILTAVFVLAKGS